MHPGDFHDIFIFYFYLIVADETQTDHRRFNRTVGNFFLTGISAGVLYLYFSQNIERYCWSRPHIQKLVSPAEKPLAEEHLKIPFSEDGSYLTKTLSLIFGGSANADTLKPEERVIEILKYVSSVIRPGKPGGSGTDALKNRLGACDSMAKALIALVRKSGIPARFVTMANLKVMGSHTGVEVFYENNWHFLTQPSEYSSIPEKHTMVKDTYLHSNRYLNVPKHTTCLK